MNTTFDLWSTMGMFHMQEGSPTYGTNGATLSNRSPPWSHIWLVWGTMSTITHKGASGGILVVCTMRAGGYHLGSTVGPVCF